MSDNETAERKGEQISRRRVLQVAGATGVAGLAGCAGQSGSPGGGGGNGDGDGGDGGSETVVDMAGREVQVPGTIESVMGLGPTGLRQVSQMGVADMVVGVEENEQGWSKEIPYNMANPQFQDLPVVGPQFGGEPELIAQEGPDVIFYCCDADGAADLQTKTGIPVFLVDQGDMGPNRDVIYDSWRMMGKVLGKQDRAESLVDYIETSITDLNDRTKDVPDSEKLESYAGGVSHRGPQGLNSTKAPFPPLEWVNAKFAAEEFDLEDSDRDRLKVQVSREKILEWDPEVIFVDLANLKTVREDVQKNKEYQDLNAIQNDRVYGYHPYHQYHFNASTTVANAYFMGSALYPDRFDDVSPAEKADEVYETFFGSAVYDQMAGKFGEYGKVDLG